jgi:uncharacterized membrane protein
MHPRESGELRGSRRALALGAVWLLALAPVVARAERVWADLEQPYAGQLVREAIGLVEVRGWAGTGVRGSHDVVLAIDRSASTFRPSGVDVDGDGTTGEIVRVRARGGERRMLTDPDDTIAGAQLLAARRLIDRLDTRSTRMGIITFGRTERVHARVGTPAEQLRLALDRLPNRPEEGGTYFYGALIAAMKVLEQAESPDGEERHRSIILLSDGLPNEPPPPALAAKAAVRASKHASREQIRIYAFALGPTVAARPQVFLEMVRANGGELLIVEQPGEIIEYVPYMSLTKLASVDLENATTGEPGRAVRLFPDGTFDGFAPLVPGENLLRVTAQGEAGGVRVLELPVRFEKTAGLSDEDRRRLEQLLRDLRARTVETELAQRARAKRQEALRRTLEITVDRDSRPEPPGTTPTPEAGEPVEK